jgi:hypothetical protein
MKDVEGDNVLKINKTKSVKEKDFSRVSKNGIIMNTKEVTHFIKTPSEKILKEYEDVLEKINVADIEMPTDLLGGKGIPCGDLQKGSKFIPMTFGTDPDHNSMPIVYISAQKGGKSTFLRKYGVEAVSRGDSIFAFDTIDGQNIQIIRDYLPGNIPDEKIIYWSC